MGICPNSYMIGAVPHSWFLAILTRLAMSHLVSSLMSQRLALGLAALVLAAPAMAYKTERVCETTPPTLKAPAREICKTMLVMTEAQKAATGKKDEKKEEKKPEGHH